MPRHSRVVGVDLPHHITQRGNYQQKLFESERDRQRYLRWVSDYSQKSGLSVLAYCLMSNHVHFVAVPNQKESMASTFKSAHMRYSQYFNCSHGISGHLWQGRFYSCILSGAHLLAAARYVERNPVRAGLVGLAEDWEWSSAAAHVGDKGDNYGFALGDLMDMLGVTRVDWRELLRGEDETGISEIRIHTRTGLPLGDNGFIENLEEDVGCRLHALPVGRPKEGPKLKNRALSLFSGF